jgi:hypothetical protein
VIVHDLDFFRAGGRPSENDPPLIVYANRITARELPFEQLKVIARGAARSPSTAAPLTITSLRRAILARFAENPFGDWRPIRIASANFPLKLRIATSAPPARSATYHV